MTSPDSTLGSRFLWKAFAGYGLLILLTVAVLGELITDRVRDDLEAELTRELRAAAHCVAGEALQMLRERGDETSRGFGETVLATARSAELRFTLFDGSGQVFADTAVPVDEPAVLAGDDGGWREALSAGEFSGPIGATAGGAAALAFAQRLDDDGVARGVLRASRPRAAVDRPIAAVRDLVLAALAVALLSAFALAFARARAIERPLQRMSAVAQAMAQGDFSHRLSIDDRDAFGELAHALNQLGSVSRDRIDVMATDRSRVLAILGAMVEGVVAVDEDECIVHLNTAAARILDTQSGHAIGRRVWEVTRIREVSDILAQALRTGEERSAQVRVVAPPRDRWVELHASPLHDSDGVVAGAVVVLHDVSDLRRLEAIRRDFVANVSHELKTPITAIRGMVETVLDDPDMDEQHRQSFLRRIREQTGRLATLVVDLLTLSRLEAEGSAHELEVLDLRVPVRESLQALAEPAALRGIEVELEEPDRPVRVLGDLESLRLLASNLLDNAVKYTPQGGQVWLRLRTDADHAILDVVDTGIGIDRKHLDRIFQRFYRVDKARSRELGGTGLGLSIVKHVCATHRGDVSVESEPGRGSTFRVRLPLV
ncbi:MAG: PAS domain-containing protein [Planctomycetes bacterium]|nr:PAS domain-containing protein [Planctomycetota bacterium]